MTSGVGTTSAGLTCSAVRNATSGEWSLEAGALVLADNGVCCIDEFGCIKECDRTAIHEAMEQQTLSVAKAGLVVKLNTRATVVATMNPIGVYDTNKSVAENSGCGSPLLSRFDLIFVMLDVDDCSRDLLVSAHLLNASIKGVNVGQGFGVDVPSTDEGGVEEGGPGSLGTSKLANLWDMSKLRNYIADCKERFQPALSEGARNLMNLHYTTCRSLQNSSMEVTVRFLESMIRLSQAHARLMHRHVVETDDAVAVILLLECSASVAGGLYNTTDRTSNNLFVDCMKDFDDMYDAVGIDAEADDAADMYFDYMKCRLLRRYNLLRDSQESEEE